MIFYMQLIIFILFYIGVIVPISGYALDSDSYTYGYWECFAAGVIIHISLAVSVCVVLGLKWLFQ